MLTKQMTICFYFLKLRHPVRYSFLDDRSFHVAILLDFPKDEE